MRTRSRNILLGGLILLSSCGKDRYPDPKPPGREPVVFAPGRISTDLDEYGCTFSPDGDEFYFTRTFLDPRRHAILMSRRSEDGWSAPAVASFSTSHSEGEPNFRPDGRLLFYGRLEQSQEGGLVSMIYTVSRTKKTWSEPSRIGSGMSASSTAEGVLYFTDVSEGMDRGDIVRAVYREDGSGELLERESVDGVNSPYQDAHPFIARDEGYLIFDSNRPGGFGSSDLYISRRLPDETWSPPVNLGKGINTAGYDAIPCVSPDERYFFFYQNGDIYWVKADVLWDVRP